MTLVKFVPKARLINILGEQLIKDATVGIVELVKNSYDADATEVEVIMDSVHTSAGKIIIKDNGSGIDLDTFLNKWMNPATGHKEDLKNKMIRTDLGRLPLGEKGVGRFAAQQIGNRLVVQTKTINSELELFVDIDWKKFKEPEKDLSEVEIYYDTRISKIFKTGDKGTILNISEIKNPLTKKEIEKIADTLKRLKSPFKGANNFNVSLKFENCPDEFKIYEDLSIGDILEKAHYKFVAMIDSNGILSYEYDFNVPGEKKNYKTGEVNLIDQGRIVAGTPLSCGGIYMQLYNYYGEKSYNWLKKSNIKNDNTIKALSGISIYRDGIRVLPYGEKDNDWLQLDERKRQRGEKRKIDNRMTIGFVEINQENNLVLKDKTNREGFIENNDYELFKSLVFEVIAEFELNRVDDVPDVIKKSDIHPKERLDDKTTDTLRNINTIISHVSNNPGANSRVVTGDLINLQENIESIKKEYVKTVDEFDEINKRLFNLAGTGLAAERFTHEFSRLVAGASASLDRLVKLINAHTNPNDARMKKEVNAIYSALEALKNDIRLLGPMFYVNKVTREKELNIYDVIKNTISLQEHLIEKEDIKINLLGDPFKVVMREGSCMQIFNNLLDNSIYWLLRKSEKDKKQINIIMIKDEMTVYVSDSGPGISSRYHGKIFDPFFSLKSEDGRGLGLYIIKEILDEKNFDISLIDQDENASLLSGASFKIVFLDKKNFLG